MLDRIHFALDEILSFRQAGTPNAECRSKKSLLPNVQKFVNLISMLAVQRFVIALALGSLISPGLLAQTPAAISYGSLAPTGSNAISSSQTQPAPIFIAQNTIPAPITAVPATPSAISTPAPATILSPFDPYVVDSPQTWFGMVVPASNEPVGQNQSVYSNVYSGNFDKFIPETYAAMRRFREATSFEYTFLPRRGKANGFGINEIDIRMQLAFPCRFIPNNGRSGFFYLAPAASFVWWDGPSEPAMPPNAFGTFLDFGIQPRFNDQFSLNAWGRFGVFSDFVKVSSDALRYQGRLEGIYNATQQLEIHAGVIYYGRSRIKLLPTAGFVLAPDENWLLRLVFPDFKIQRRIWKGPQADWWGYVRLDYSGGSWDISEHPGLTDYNDIRLGAGIEFAMPHRLGGYFEFGGSFDRELYFGGRRQADLPSVIYLKTGVIF